MVSQEPLLPGIPDDFTLREIVTKVSWKELDVLACVSRGWRNIIRSGQVYEERVRSGLTETFIIADTKSRLVVCCLRDKSLLELPRCPGAPEGLGWSHSVVVDGKVYILGHGFPVKLGEIVYMFDLRGQRVWTRCASMQIQRSYFGCGLMDGKIYVFGGFTKDGRTCEVEVFDPKENIWSKTTPMPVARTEHRVVAFGEELVLYGGSMFDRFTGMITREPEYVRVDPLQIYHPLKDEWRSEPYPFPINYYPRVLFVAQGKLHLMSHSSIEIQDFDGTPSRGLHSNSYVPMGEGGYLTFQPNSVLVVDDEILALGVMQGGSNFVAGMRLLRSRGFATETKEMDWREERDWSSIGRTYSIHAFQL